MGDSTKSPFAKLAQLRDQLPAGENKRTNSFDQASATTATDSGENDYSQRIVLRIERKGRGGKTVTLIQFPDGAPSEEKLQSLATTLKKALGTGAQCEQSDRVVIQGDQVDRLAQWFAAHGAKRVIRAN